MGTIRKGILGGFHGTVGTVVGSFWNGINVMRSLPETTNTDFSATQLAAQARFD